MKIIIRMCEIIELSDNQLCLRNVVKRKSTLKGGAERKHKKRFEYNFIQ